MLKRTLVCLMLLLAVLVTTACSAENPLAAGGNAGNQAGNDGAPIPVEPEDMLPPFDAEAEARLATIRGEFRFPTEEVPALVIYFRNVQDRNEIYTLDMPEGRTDTHYYERQLPPGEYEVFAYTRDGTNRFAGAYTTDVFCDDTSECVGGRLISVTLGESEKVGGIDLYLAADPSTQEIPAEPVIEEQMVAPDDLPES